MELLERGLQDKIYENSTEVDTIVEKMKKPEIGENEYNRIEMRKIVGRLKQKKKMKSCT